MDFDNIVDNISTQIELKRIASRYVFDYRSLSKEELVDALKKTRKQYFDLENVLKSYNSCLFSERNDLRVLAPIILVQILLNEDDYSEECKSVNEKIIKYEQEIVSKANEFSIAKNQHNKDKLELLKFVLSVALEDDNDISLDEKKLLSKIQKKLGIGEEEFIILKAQLGFFPQNKNILHSYSQIAEVRKDLQSLGLLFQIRDSENINYDVIPQEIAKSLRTILGIEIKQQGYLELLKNKRLRSKEYMQNIIDKSGLDCKKILSLKEMQDFVVMNIKPTSVIGGFSARDGLPVTSLIEWSKELSLPSNKTKEVLIAQIIEYYDNLKKIEAIDADPRELYFENYELLAGRKIEELRKKGIIQKDIECERLFEKATHYIFEVLLNVKPIQQIVGNEHADGILAFNDKLIMWDNKSKETDVNLQDHIEQFDRYIKSSEKPVSIFAVIAPSFTENSIEVQTRYQLTNDTLITLIKASDLKEMALRWKQIKGTTPFPLGYFKQPGKFFPNIKFF